MTAKPNVELLKEVKGFLETAWHHRRKEVAAMWLMGDYAERLLYSHHLTHSQIVAAAGVSMFELTRALTIRATYPTLEHIPEGK